MVADVVVIAALHFVDRGMKAEKELERIKAEKEDHQVRETTKESARAQKAATRDEQKRSMKQQKNNGMKKAQHNIQQPSKSKKN